MFVIKYGPLSWNTIQHVSYRTRSAATRCKNSLQGPINNTRLLCGLSFLFMIHNLIITGATRYLCLSVTKSLFKIATSLNATETIQHVSIWILSSWGANYWIPSTPEVLFYSPYQVCGWGFVVGRSGRRWLSAGCGAGTAESRHSHHPPRRSILSCDCGATPATRDNICT